MASPCGGTSARTGRPGASWSPTTESTCASHNTRNAGTANTAPKVAGTGSNRPTTAAAVVGRLEPVPATFGAVFAVPAFRVLWLAQVLSVVGDQLARVALSVLTFHRTGSPLLTGAGYALSYLPAVAGGTSSPPRRPAVAAAGGGLRPGAAGAGRRDGRTGRAVLGALYAARRRRAAECAVRCGPGGAAARGAPGRPVRRRQCRQQLHHPGRRSRAPGRPG